MTMTLLPMLPTALTTPPPRPCPNASSSTTEITPQVMPSMVSAERMRLRCSAAQLCVTSSLRRIVYLGSFVMQTLDRLHLGGAACGINPSTHGDKRKREQGQDHCSRGDDRLGNEVGEWDIGHQQANTNPEAVADQTAKNGNDHRFGK